MIKYQIQEADKVYYMNVAMVSEYLHIAKSTIYKWAEESYIPHKKLGKRVIFIKNEIDDWVLNNGAIVKDLPTLPTYNVQKEEKVSDKKTVTVRYTDTPSERKYFTVTYRRPA